MSPAWPSAAWTPPRSRSRPRSSSPPPPPPPPRPPRSPCPAPPPTLRSSCPPSPRPAAQPTASVVRLGPLAEFAPEHLVEFTPEPDGDLTAVGDLGQHQHAERPYVGA